MAECQFCGRPSVARCNEGLPDPRIVYLADVQNLDFIQHNLDLQFYAVKKIERPKGEYWVVSLLEGPRHSVKHEYNHSMPILRMETRDCGAVVCDLHYRSYNDDQVQCPLHWPDVQQVYSVA